jgi:hypothetical protein
LIKDARFYTANKSALITSATTQYNCSGAGAGLDVSGYDEAVLRVNAGTFSGDGTLAVTLTQYDTDAALSSSAVTGATITTITTSNDEASYNGSVALKACKKYLWVKAVKGGTGNAQFAIELVLTKKDSVPFDNSPIFDV